MHSNLGRASGGRRREGLPCSLRLPFMSGIHFHRCRPALKSLATREPIWRMVGASSGARAGRWSPAWRSPAYASRRLTYGMQYSHAPHSIAGAQWSSHFHALIAVPSQAPRVHANTLRLSSWPALREGGPPAIAVCVGPCSQARRRMRSVLVASPSETSISVASRGRAHPAQRAPSCVFEAPVNT